jgi:hypothetical protein
VFEFRQADRKEMHQSRISHFSYKSVSDLRLFRHVDNDSVRDSARKHIILGLARAGLRFYGAEKSAEVS